MNLHQGNLHEVWPFVYNGLESVRRNTPCDWLPEDIYAALKAGEMFLFTAKTGKAFAIVRTSTDCLSGRKYLYIVAAYSAKNFSQPEFMPQFEGLAKETGCSYIEMESNRQGFQRTGWKLDRHTYRWEVA